MKRGAGGRSRPAVAGGLLVAALMLGVAPVAHAEWLGPETETEAAEAPQQWPQLSGKRLIYTTESDQGGFEVRVQNLSDGSDRVISAGHPASGRAAVSGQRVVWSDSGARLWLADLKTGRHERLTVGPADDPAISGNRVCYTYLGQIKLVNLATGARSTISAPDATAANCDLDGKTVVWQQRGADPGIVSYQLDGGRSRMLTTDQSARFARIDGDVVVWQTAAEGSEPSDIVVKHLATGTEQVIASQQGAAFPQVSDGQVVWQDSRLGRGNTEVYFFDLASGIESRVTFGDDWSGHPAIESGRVVYEDVREGRQALYLRAIDPPELKLDLAATATGQPTLTGSAASSTGVPLVSARLQLEYRNRGTDWQAGEQLTTAGDGTFTSPIPEGTDLVRVRFVGSYDYAPAVSPSVRLN